MWLGFLWSYFGEPEPQTTATAISSSLDLRRLLYTSPVRKVQCNVYIGRAAHSRGQGKYGTCSVCRSTHHEQFSEQGSTWSVLRNTTIALTGSRKFFDDPNWLCTSLITHERYHEVLQGLHCADTSHQDTTNISYRSQLRLFARFWTSQGIGNSWHSKALIAKGHQCSFWSDNDNDDLLSPSMHQSWNDSTDFGPEHRCRPFSLDLTLQLHIFRYKNVSGRLISFACVQSELHPLLIDWWWLLVKLMDNISVEHLCVNSRMHWWISFAHRGRFYQCKVCRIVISHICTKTHVFSVC